MNNYKIGTVISLAIALVACPSGVFVREKASAKRAPVGRERKPNPKDPGGHSAAGVEAAKKQGLRKGDRGIYQGDRGRARRREKLFQSGDRLSRRQQIGGSIGGFFQGDRARPDRMPEVTSAAARCSSSKNNWTRRWRILIKPCKLPPTTLNARRFRGFVFISKSEWEKAIEDYSIGVQKVPDDDSAYERRAFAYRNLKKYKEAIADYSKVISKDPKDPEGYRRRASTHTMAGDSKNAAADFRALLKIKPDDVDAQSRLKALETRANSSPAATSQRPVDRPWWHRGQASPAAPR